MGWYEREDDRNNRTMVDENMGDEQQRTEIVSGGGELGAETYETENEVMQAKTDGYNIYLTLPNKEAQINCIIVIPKPENCPPCDYTTSPSASSQAPTTSRYLLPLSLLSCVLSNFCPKSRIASRIEHHYRGKDYLAPS